MGHSVLKIEPSKPLLQIKTSLVDKVLVDEWSKILVSLTNTDVLNYGKINFACQLQALDSQRKTCTEGRLRINLIFLLSLAQF
jgi:hypothetical protein